MVEQRLNIEMRQGLVMTPQLQMAIKLLQMSSLDLQSYIETEMLENPFLKSDENSEEVAPDQQDSQELDSAEKMDSGELETESMDYDWEDMYDSGRGASAQSVASDDDALSWEQTATKEESLKEHLNNQIGLMTDDPVLTFLLKYLIDDVDDAGYLRTDTDDLARKLAVDDKRMHQALKMLQSMEPTGVGARDLAECLKIQLINDVDLVDDTALLILEHLDLLAQQDFKKLMRLAKVEREDIELAAQQIRNLNPKPGLLYGGENASAVVPDIMVSRDSQGQWIAELNAEAMPKVLINRGYDNLKAKGDDKSFVHEKKNRAQWLVKSLEQRARSIYKTANAILEMQADFFDFGVESLKPMTLKEVAEKIDVHESTVSRVTTGKYMQTPLGVFELKFFFSSAINTTGGTQSVAAESVKQMIKRLVSEEDRAKPLSDEKLVKMLKAEGVDVARRTIAKYREALGIGSSSERRIRPT